jgi:hypothetical protein
VAFPVSATDEEEATVTRTTTTTTTEVDCICEGLQQANPVRLDSGVTSVTRRQHPRCDTRVQRDRASSSSRKPLTPIVEVAAETLLPLECNGDTCNNGDVPPEILKSPSSSTSTEASTTGRWSSSRRRRLVKLPSKGREGNDSTSMSMSGKSTSTTQPTSLQLPSWVKTLSTSPSLLLGRQSKAPKPCLSCTIRPNERHRRIWRHLTTLQSH